MKPAKLSTYTLTRGNTFKEILRFTSAGEPIDLSQFSEIRMDIRDALNSTGNVLETVAIDSGISIDGNLLTITIEASKTRQWVPGNYYRDLVFVNAQNEVYTWAEGSIKVRDYITEVTG